MPYRTVPRQKGDTACGKWGTLDGPERPMITTVQLGQDSLPSRRSEDFPRGRVAVASADAPPVQRPVLMTFRADHARFMAWLRAAGEDPPIPSKRRYSPGSNYGAAIRSSGRCLGAPQRVGEAQTHQGRWPPGAPLRASGTATHNAPTARHTTPGSPRAECGPAGVRRLPLVQLMSIMFIKGPVRVPTAS